MMVSSKTIEQQSGVSGILSNMVYLQAIHVEWSEESQTGENADCRRKIPEVFELRLPEEQKIKQGYIIQHIFYCEIDGFEKPYYEDMKIMEKTKKISYNSTFKRPYARDIMMPYSIIFQEKITDDQFDENLRYCRLRLFWKDDTLKVKYQPNNDEFKAKTTAFTLTENQWGQIQYNNSYLLNAGWVYEKWIFNVGFGSLPSQGIFLENQPVKVYSKIKKLSIKA